jgi:SagB-type dehydrogenase family enzyme
VTEFLAEAGMLSAVGENEALEEDEDDNLRMWEFHDLLFHDRSRRGRHDGQIGGSFRFRDQIPAVPLRREEPASEPVELSVPDLAAIAADGPSFGGVLESRRSARPVGAEITLGQLSELLYRSARAQRHDEEHGTSWRPYPTGGAVGELEVYATVERCTGLEPGMYRYDSLDHQLVPVATIDAACARLLDAAAAAQGRTGPPAVLLTLASRFARVSWKYEGLAYALTLKNAGCLLQTICLVAASMEVAACALGTGSSADFARAADLPEHAEGPVSEITVG